MARCSKGKPYNLAAHAAYQAEYQKSPEQVKRREERNVARAHAEKKLGKAALKGRDVDHKKMLKDGGSNADSNTRVVSEKSNRGWRKNRSGY